MKNIRIYFWAFLALGMLSGCLADVTILGDLIHKQTLVPGDSVAGTITVLNDAETPAIIRITQSDYIYQSDGSSYFETPSSIARSNARWIEFSPKQLTVPPREKSDIYYQIQVPAQDSLYGSYWSVLLIEPIQQPSPDEEDQFRVITIFRYAVQIISSIQGTGEIQLQFMNAGIEPLDGKRQLGIELGNIGDIVIRPEVWIEVYSETGDFLGKFTAQPAHLLPSCSRRLLIDISTLPSGIHKAIVIADCGDDNVFGMNIKLDIH
ncbi:hypothetical protein JW948_12300 [bacterium]|nr:hypothetical protein [bacterium]